MLPVLLELSTGQSLKKKRSDLVVGVVIFLSIVILVAGVVFLKNIELGSKTVSYTAIFSNVGGLQQGDPVTVLGVKGKGSVSKVYLRGDSVAVAFKIDSEVKLTDSCQIKVVNVGLLGERKVEIFLNRLGSPYEPDTETDTFFIPGTFDYGIAEAIGMLGTIMEDASGTLDTINYFVEQTVASPEFVDFWDRTVTRVDTIVDLVEGVLDDNDNSIKVLVNDLRVASRKLRAIVDSSDESVYAIADNFETFSQQTIDLGHSVDSLLEQLQGIVAKIDTGDGTVADLINNKEVSEQLVQTLTAVDSLVDVTNDKGLRLRVKLGFGDRKRRSKK